VWGRRRVGKTRLLLEWSGRQGGVSAVADQSAPEAQRAYLARAFAEVLPGFADVTYPDWERLFARLAADALARNFAGPIVIDELPYLVAASPELPSVLQRWIDHDARRARLAVALAGSSQPMMQSLVLAQDAPLYGRARVLLDLQPLAPTYLPQLVGRVSGARFVEHWAAWGGVPRYWELAASQHGPAARRLVALALDPLGPLFSEPERLLLEESPPALEVRPVLDAIGAGAHRVSKSPAG
jgi:AAA+ ATPase superfamily predicted ATPase